jgi:hypothetical protein
MFVWWCFLFVSPLGVAAQRKIRCTHDIVEHEGVLSFVQLESEIKAEVEFKDGMMLETEMHNAPIYGILPEYDWEGYDAKGGVTISFDRKAHSLVMNEGIDEAGGIAWGYMVDGLDEHGWIQLYVTATASPSVTNDVKIYAAGYLEGLITGFRISQFYTNAHAVLLKDAAASGALTNVKRMFHNEVEYMKKQANFHAGVLSMPPLDPYWAHARWTLFQVWGMRDGFNWIAMNKGVLALTMVDMWTINANAVLPELMEAFTPAALKARRAYQSKVVELLQAFNHERTAMAREKLNAELENDKKGKKGNLRPGRSNTPEKILGVSSEARPSMLSLSNEPMLKNISKADHSSVMDAAHNQTAFELMMEGDSIWQNKLRRGGRCSAFVRVTPENKDLLVGHTTWDDYSKMTRIFKYYKWKIHGAWASVSHIGMSSYPGCVSSTDNFFMLDNGLVIMDTSLEILNTRIYDRIAEFPNNPHIPTWAHVMMVNRMARNAVQWQALFSERNNGQENAQWMIIDYNKFVPNFPLPDGSFFVVEMIPGTIAKSELAGHIRSSGYFASYNRPFFAETRAQTGHAAAEAHYGALFSYGGNPRATIFANHGPNVANLFDMRLLMRRNQYPGEGILPNAPGHAISARNDLDLVNLLPNGGIDAKITNRCLFAGLQCQAISGPTHDSQAVFTWCNGDKDTFPGWPHMGLPCNWGFDWVQFTPSQMLDRITDQNSC